MRDGATQNDLEQLQRELDDMRAALRASAAEAQDSRRQLERYAEDLRETFKEERERAAALQRSYMATVRALAGAVEARDSYTGGHAERVAAYGIELATAVGLDLQAEPELEFGFLLHDIGKVAVPDAILFKPGPLTPEEREVVARHPEVGFEILREVEFLGDARLVVLHHHEHWNGSGYPHGLAGERIPLAARVFSVVDTLDALTSRRPYREPVSLARARQTIEEVSGSQFDPDVVAAFAEIPDATFERIRRA